MIKKILRNIFYFVAGTAIGLFIMLPLLYPAFISMGLID